MKKTYIMPFAYSFRIDSRSLLAGSETLEVVSGTNVSDIIDEPEFIVGAKGSTDDLESQDFSY